MNLRYQSHKFDITNKNPLFSEAKIYIMYHGENRNNSYISKEDVDKSMSSLYNIPIVGEFIESEADSEESNFGSHGGKIVVDDNGIKFIQTTKPVGVVPESANVYWETIKDEKEREREYLVVDGALVWNRYQEEVNALKGANFGQSMEVEVEDGWFDDEDGLYHITDFFFSALCILGIDGRKNGKVEPAFEDSKIITYSNEETRDEIKEMKSDLQKFYSLHSLGKEEDKLKDKVKFEDENKETEEENKEPKTVQTETEGRDGQVITDEEEAEKQKGTSGDTGAGDATDTADTTSDARAIADANTDAGATTDTTTDTTAGTTGNTDTANTTADTTDTADTTSEARRVADANTDTTDYAKKYEELKKEHDEVLKELEGLREFKATSDKEKHEKASVELFDKLGLEEKDVEGIDIYKYSIEELEEKAYAILGKKTASNKEEFSVKPEADKQSNKVNLSQSSVEKSTSKYGNLFKKYSKQ